MNFKTILIFFISFTLLFSCKTVENNKPIKEEKMQNKNFKERLNPLNEKILGGIVRGPQNSKNMSLVFTGDSFAECSDLILDTLKKNDIKGSFFFTGKFYCKYKFKKIVKRIVSEGHYISIHSNAHLLYAPWEDRNKTLVTKEQFIKDINLNFKELEKFGVKREDAIFWIPPYEWYNETISEWSNELGLILINHTTGTLSSADYTLDTDKNFRSNDAIYESIIKKEQKDGLNGFMLLTHIGAGSGRSVKFAERLPELINYLKDKGYTFLRVDELLTTE